MSITRRPEESSPRTQWHLRANAPIIAWLFAAAITTGLHPFVPHATWLMVHTLVLGAVTNAIVVWSSHFAETLTRSNPTALERRWQSVRLGVLNASILAVIAGRMADNWYLVLVGAIGVGLVILAHGWSIYRRLRSALANRFAVTLNYYLVAACMLPIGAGFGAWIAYDTSIGLAPQVTLAHATVNIFGWIGLTVAGTLVTLWPTILRTRVADNAVTVTRWALWVLVVGIAITVLGSLAGQHVIGAVGVAVYTAGWVTAMGPRFVEARQRPPHSFAALSLLAAVLWLMVALIWWFVIWATEPSLALIEAEFSTIVATLVVGFAAQVLIGAMSHLLPVVLGGGPQATRSAHAVLDRGAGLRLIVTNLGLAVCLLPVPSVVRVILSLLVVIALAAFLPLAFLARRAARRERGRLTEPRDREESRRQIEAAQHPPRHRAWVVAGLTAVSLAVAWGIAADPNALPGSVAAVDAGVQPTGETTRVVVEAKDMRFYPASVDVPAGNRLVIELRNTDKADAHDLALASGHRTKRLAPGQTEVLDVGVIGESIDGWCTVVGHRQMGMVFAVNVVGGGNTMAADPSGPPHEGMTGGVAARKTGAAADLDFMALAPKGFKARDARLPKAPAGKTHRYTFTVSDVVAEVAPGVEQKLWTYNKTAPGPTLRGKVGDRFVIKLVNDTDMAHSIDFHASRVAPDRLMKPIGPGETLEYEFVAEHSGIWMYHCGTMPMAVHIASGLFGAVIIDPPNLPKVDREYLLIQSELFLGEQKGLLDADKLAREEPDAVVFNGYANQYQYDPLPAKVDERVRFWVLDVGPNRPSSFHVIGTQFDTVWFEGDYQLRPNNKSKGASQAFGLQAAQGGFVEMTFPEVGRYPFVSHIMVDGERGAFGYVEVKR